MKYHFLSKDWVEKEIPLTLTPGNVLVLYTDEGPSGLCGQSMDITCPHTVLLWFPDQDTCNDWCKEHKVGRSGVKAQIKTVVIGEWSSPGKFTLGVWDGND